MFGANAFGWAYFGQGFAGTTGPAPIFTPAASIDIRCGGADTLLCTVGGQEQLDVRVGGTESLAVKGGADVG